MNLDHPTMHGTFASGTVAAATTTADVSLNSVSVSGAEAATSADGLANLGGRVFDSGELRYVILQLIAEKPRHGYELMKAIEDRLSGAYSPSPGLIYPT